MVGGRIVATVLALALAPAVASCGSSLPLPEMGDHTGDEPVIVPYPPPPPLVELVPDQPANQPDAVWVDGEWLWRGRRLEWQKPRWEVAPKGATFAPPAIVYLADKQIAWFVGRWHVRRGP